MDGGKYPSGRLVIRLSNVVSVHQALVHPVFVVVPFFFPSAYRASSRDRYPPPSVPSSHRGSMGSGLHPGVRRPSVEIESQSRYGPRGPR